MQKPLNRFFELDVLRGTAIIGMVTFHYFYILDYLHFFRNNMYEGVYLLLARVVQFLFLTLHIGNKDIYSAAIHYICNSSFYWSNVCYQIDPTTYLV